MSDGSEQWRVARRSWERLHGQQPRFQRGHADPLQALIDIGIVRRLLDEVELDAVRSARQQGRSWAEIAIKLGVTRQSAWERWRELDEERTAPRTGPPLRPAAPESQERGEGLVEVPGVVGMPYDDALEMLTAHDLVGVPDDPFGTSSALDILQGAVVTDQNPDSGVLVRPGTSVTLWTASGGGSGVREPRRPRPSPLAEHGYGEPSAEAAG